MTISVHPVTRSLTPRRWRLWFLRRRRLQLTLQCPTLLIVLAHRPPGRCVLQPRLSRLGWSRSLTLTVPLCSISSQSPNPAPTHVTRHAARVLGRYIAFCATSTMGRLDRPRFNHPDHGLGSGDLRHEKDIGFTKSPQEEDCRKCRNERRELLQSTGPGVQVWYPILLHRTYCSCRQWSSRS